MKKQSFLAAAVVIGIIAIAFMFTSCGPTKRDVEAVEGLPASYVMYSGRFEMVNDSIAKMGIFIYEKHLSNSHEWRFYCVNPS